jgi:hypothetical protein
MFSAVAFITSNTIQNSEYISILWVIMHCISRVSLSEFHFCSRM